VIQHWDDTRRKRSPPFEERSQGEACCRSPVTLTRHRCVHSAGVACEMDAILDIANRHGIPLVEDAAQGVMASYKGRALGSIGALGTYSFHETKNLFSGEGGVC
jgi:DegT/DnrJ/EryC1/StrS aminotransferase family